MSTNYELGVAFERRVMADLSRRGLEVFRSAGSRGKADVLGIRPGRILLVQCKRSGDIEREEWNEVWALAQRLEPAGPGNVVIPLLALMPGKRGIAYRQIRSHAEHRQQRTWTPWNERFAS